MVFAALLSAALCGCGISAVIVDRSETKTTLTDPRLEGEPNFRVLLGGAVRDIPFDEVRMVKIDPAESISFERRLYYSAQVILQDGTVLSESGTDSTFHRQCYISVQNVITGYHRGERFSIPLQNVQQLKVEH